MYFWSLLSPWESYLFEPFVMLFPLSLLLCLLMFYSPPPHCQPPLPPSASLSLSQYALVYKDFSLHKDDLLYWQLPAQFTGDKVTVKTFGSVPCWPQVTHSDRPPPLLSKLTIHPVLSVAVWTFICWKFSILFII